MLEAGETSAPTARKLTAEQRKQVLKWMAAGDDDYRSLKALLKEHGFPPLTRGAIYYYRKQLGRARCAACGQTLPEQD
jgi:hypothetical protein